MVAINKILLPECTGEGCAGETRNPPHTARLHARSTFHFLLSPCCRRSRPGSHPGNNAPLPVHSTIRKSSLTIGPPPPPPLML